MATAARRGGRQQPPTSATSLIVCSPHQNSAMAPRRRQAVPSAQTAIASLPNALLERILGLLQQRDRRDCLAGHRTRSSDYRCRRRHRRTPHQHDAWQPTPIPGAPSCCRHRAALVSRRWNAAAHSPTALQQPIKGPAGRRLPSLTAWLWRHGRQVRSLNLSSYVSGDDVTPYTWELASCLAVCALTAAESLRQLTIYLAGGGTLCIATWCVALRQLGSLSVSSSSMGEVRISCNLSSLTALTQLAVEGKTVTIDDLVQLPPAVERLRFSDSTSTALPHQASATCGPSVGSVEV